jgi:putative ABC transport system permease protein
MRIGWRNMRRERLRFAIAIAGIMFAVVLVTLEVGLLSGLMRNASLLIDTARADLWISAPELQTIDFSTPFANQNKFRVLTVAGVEKAECFSLAFTGWKLPTGRTLVVQIVGIDTRGDLYAPIDVVEGNLEDLRLKDTVIVDEDDREKLGNPSLGDNVEIYNHRAKIVGFTRHMKSFSTAPFVFTGQHSFPIYSFMGSFEKPIALLIKVAPGFTLDAVKNNIGAAMPDVEAHTLAEFSWRTRRFWLIKTGMGVGFLGAALLGLLVGGAIVSQTLFAITIEKIPEYALLKAIGASMSELAYVVLEQAMACGVAGILLGLIISLLLVQLGPRGFSSMIQISAPLILLVAGIVAALCAAASIAPIARLRRVEPVRVFQS